MKKKKLSTKELLEIAEEKTKNIKGGKGIGTEPLIFINDFFESIEKFIKKIFSNGQNSN